MVNVNEKKLGISPKLNRFGMPFANLLVGSTSGVLLVVILYYLAEYYAVPVNIGWFLTLWVMCSIMCMAAPPVSGGMLVVTGMLMLQLNIPSEGLAVAGLLSIIMDFISTATKIGISHYEMMIEADKLKMLDRSVLLSPSDNCNDA
jgi:Na+/H+-dicarboxylate symporter